MLHEILLALSGIHSPLWSSIESAEQLKDGNVSKDVSPSERAMVAGLLHLGQLHAKVQKAVSSMQIKHPSPICRAISSRITSKHLRAFREKIIQVEAAVLSNDTEYVGAYQIVPLSTIAADFNPWNRRMNWLCSTTDYMFDSKAGGKLGHRTGADVLKYLDEASHTGFTEIQSIAIDLLTIAQHTWMRSASCWILYGQLPSLGREDFMVREHESTSLDGLHRLDCNLVPFYVTPTCSADFLSVGNALNQLRSKRLKNHGVQEVSSIEPITTLLPAHLANLTKLTYPLNPILLEKTISNINQSISTNALSQLLPLQQTQMILQVIQDYLLLARGEFGITLINNIDRRFELRSSHEASLAPVRKLGRSDIVHVKSAELDALLVKTWSDLIALQGEVETEDQVFRSARELLKFSTIDLQLSSVSEIVATLAPILVLLRLDIPVDSPLNILIPSPDIAKYAHINAHLLSMRRAEMRLSGLWKLTSQRRCHPSPMGPPMSSTAYGKQALTQRRRREDQRTLHTRRHWSSMSNVLFFLNEFRAYLHGEVVYNSWCQLDTWLRSSEGTTTPSSGSANLDSKSRTDESHKTEPRGITPVTKAIKDPRSIAQAHQAYLASLYSALLVDQPAFNAGLKTLLTLIDHFVALFNRLQAAWQGLDLQEDDGIVDAYMNYAQDEKDVLAEMDRSRTELDKTLQQLVQRLKEIEKAKEVGDTARGMVSAYVTSKDAQGDFVPWKARTLDRLIMKLDFLQQRDRGDDDEGEDELVERFEDAME